MTSSPARPVAEPRFKAFAFVVSRLAVAALFVGLCAWSWRKWSDVLVDFGNELYVPWRIAAGDVLYRDLAHAMGPASQLWNALLFQIFGVGLDTLIWANLAVLAVIVCLMSAIFARIADQLTTRVLMVFFLLVFAFAQYTGTGNYNYVCPYRHEMTHGMALLLGQLYCFLRYAESPRLGWLLGAGFCVGVIACQKAEILLPAVAMSLTAAVLLPTRKEQPRSNSILRGLAFLAAAAVPAIVCSAWLAQSLGVQEAVHAMFASLRFASDSRLSADYPLFVQLMGTDAIFANTLRMITSALGVLGVVIAACCVDVLSRPWRRGRVVLRAVLGASSAMLGWWLISADTWILLGSPLPVFTAVILVWAIVSALRVRRIARGMRPANVTTPFENSGRATQRLGGSLALPVGEAANSRELTLALWAVMSLCLLPKVFFNVQLAHYGFVLAMPATLLLLEVLIFELPWILLRRRGTGDALRAIVLGLVIACMLSLSMRSNKIFRGKRLAVGHGRDVTYHDPTANYRSAIVPEFLRDLEDRLPNDATLAVWPYGVQLNYWLRLRNPTPYFLLTPWEMIAAGGEDVVLAAFEKSPPDYVVLVREPAGDLFYTFGRPGYGNRMLRWLDANYEAIHGRAGTDDPSRVKFEMVLYRRRGDRAEE